MKKSQEKQLSQDDMLDEALETIEEQDIAEEAPSWFARTYGESKASDMASQYRENIVAQDSVPHPIVAENAAAYEAYRKRLEERFSMAQRMADPAYGEQDNQQHRARHTAQAAAQPSPAAAFPRRPVYNQGIVGQAQTDKPKKSSGFNPAILAILTLTACGVGGGAGYLAANPDKASEIVQNGKNILNGSWFQTAAVASETVISKKPIRTARLEVKDTAGAINSPIPLDIAALAADVDTPVALRISGLPPSAYLTKGVEVAKGEWMLKASDIGHAELVVPHTDLPEISLEVAAFEEKTGAPAAPAQDLNVAIDTTVLPVPGVPQPKLDVPPAKADVPQIVPVAALPDQGFNKQELPPPIPAPIESLNPEAQGLITKGDKLLVTGDLLAARQFYLRAFDLKAPAAAFGVGQTYDPAIYTKYNIRGLAPDPQQAAEWYGKAAAGGHPGAVTALAQLPQQP